MSAAPLRRLALFSRHLTASASSSATAGAFASHGAVSGNAIGSGSGTWHAGSASGDGASSDASSDGRSHSQRTTGGGHGAVAACFTSAAAAAALSTAAGSSGVAYADEPKDVALNPKEFVKFKLREVETLSHNTKVYRFELQPQQRLGLTVASCLVTRALVGPPGDDGKPKPVIRPYTPITQPDVTGYFDLLVKVYPTGKMSRHIDSLKPGDYLEVKGPIPKLPYTTNMKRSIGMVAGGTGITPMLQVIDAILRNPDDNTQVSLVFANTSPSDVLLKEKLETYAAAHPNFKVYFLVDRGDASWKGGVGYITADTLRKALPPPSDDSLVLVCGPPGMMKHVSGDKAPDKSQGEVEGLLKNLGYTKDQVYKF